MVIRLRRLIWISGLFVAAAASAPAAEPRVGQGRVDEALAAKQEMVRDQIRRLVDRMYRLSEALRETEPASAEKLRAALTQAKERLVELQADEALALLQQHQLDEARTIQQELLDSLNDVLEVMLAGPDEGERLRSEIERLEAFRQELGRLIERQQGHVDGTRQALQAGGRAAAIARAVETVRALLEAQQSLSRRTADEPAAPAGALAGEQQALSERTAEAAQQVERIGSGSEGEQSDALQNAGRSLGAAGQQMSQAAEQLSGGSAGAAGEHQQAAEQALTRALHELQKEQKQLGEPGELQQRADTQRETQKQTDRLAQRMGGGQGGQQPGQQGGQPGGEPAEGGPAPGAGRVEQAERQMGRGADALEQQRVPEGLDNQERALEELEGARRELDETLEQLRTQEQLDTLANLEERLRTILNRQKLINGQTSDLADKPPDSWERADELALAELVGRQKTNGEETSQALYILTEDATTVAFPHVLEQVVGDMRLVAGRLAKRLLGAQTQQIETDIVETLEELLAAVERKQAELQSSGQAMAGSAGNPPLLPPSAELKLLKQSQLRVNRRTALLSEGESEPAASQAELTEEAGKLSERQKDLADLAGQMHSKMTGE